MTKKALDLFCGAGGATLGLQQAGEKYPPVSDMRMVMGIDLPFTRAQVGEAVPPAYAKWIAEQA